jgi:hypothetical protein
MAPLVAGEVWSGFRVAVADPVLGTLAASEQPLSVRSLIGVWAVGVALLWFGLAYRQRSATWWEGALVLLGGAAGLVRLGNAWLLAIAIIIPLARQLSLARPHAALLVAGAAAAVAISAVIVVTTRPPALPAGADQAALSAISSGANGAAGSRPDTGAPTRGGAVFADWRWATALTAELQSSSTVLPNGGLASEPDAFWLDYVRIAQGHERWAELLRRMDVNVLVLDADGQMRRTADLVRTSPEWHVLYDADGALVAQRALSS